MPFPSLKLKPEWALIALRVLTTLIRSWLHMRLSFQNKPHWQMARQALNNVCASSVSEIHAWRTFRAAVVAEGWLVEE